MFLGKGRRPGAMGGDRRGTFGDPMEGTEEFEVTKRSIQRAKDKPEASVGRGKSKIKFIAGVRIR